MERCKRCKRMLKNTTSVVHGYGPTCWKKVEATLPKPQKKVEDFYS